MPLENAGAIASVDVNTYIWRSALDSPPDIWNKIFFGKSLKKNPHSNLVIEVKSTETTFNKKKYREGGERWHFRKLPFKK